MEKNGSVANDPVRKSHEKKEEKKGSREGMAGKKKSKKNFSVPVVMGAARKKSEKETQMRFFFFPQLLISLNKNYPFSSFSRAWANGAASTFLLFLPPPPTTPPTTVARIRCLILFALTWLSRISALQKMYRRRQPTPTPAASASVPSFTLFTGGRSN